MYGDLTKWPLLSTSYLIPRWVWQLLSQWILRCFLNALEGFIHVFTINDQYLNKQNSNPKFTLPNTLQRKIIFAAASWSLLAVSNQHFKNKLKNTCWPGDYSLNIGTNTTRQAISWKYWLQTKIDSKASFKKECFVTLSQWATPEKVPTLPFLNFHLGSGS